MISRKNCSTAPSDDRGVLYSRNDNPALKKLEKHSDLLTTSVGNSDVNANSKDAFDDFNDEIDRELYQSDADMKNLKCEMIHSYQEISRPLTFSVFL